MIVTASIVTFHTPIDEVKRAIDLAERSIIKRLIIIDNASNPQIEQLALNAGRKVSYIASANIGYGAAHNKGIAMARQTEHSHMHLVMNTDIICAPDDIARLANHMAEHPEVVAIQPRIVNPDGSLQYTVRKLPTPLDVLGRRFLPHWLIARRDDRYLLKDIDHSTTFNPPYHQGSFMFMRMSALEEVGGFDERFFMYPEDIDLTRRLHAVGQTIYWPSVTVFHHHRAASYHSWRMLWIHCVNMLRYFNKWGWWHDPQRREFNNNILL